LNGAVTPAPFMPIARANATKSATSAAGHGTHTASRCAARIPAFSIAGDTE
jgi:hypothetical protein